jgi:hypothetical protein
LRDGVALRNHGAHGKRDRGHGEHGTNHSLAPSL